VSVKVTVPIRLRVDPEALRRRPDDLAEALTAAATRALATSAKHVLDPRGRYLGLQVEPPQLTWTGSALADVSPTTRRDVEELCRRAVLDGLRASGVLEHAGRKPRSPAILGAKGAPERMNRDRFADLLGAYLLPSYDGKGKQVAVQVESDEGNDEVDEGLTGGTWDWDPVTSSDQLYRWLEFEIRRNKVDVPDPGHIGALYKNGNDAKLWLLLVHVPDNAVVFDLPISGLKRPTVDEETKKVKTVAADLPPHATYYLRYAGSIGDAKKLVQKTFGPMLDHLFRKGKKPETMSDAEYEALVKQRTQEALDAYVAALPAGITHFLTLVVDGNEDLLWIGIDVPTDLNCRVMPIAKWSPETPGSKEGSGKEGGGEEGGGEEGKGAGDGKGAGEGEGEGEGKGKGAGARRGGFVDQPGDGEPSDEGAYFPSGEGGERITLVCESFLGEPPHEKLGKEGDALRMKMEEVAFLLQMPTCNFVGNFLLNAATVLKARATTIGLWDEGAIAHAVHAPEGDGSFGSIEYHTVASAQVQLLRHLALVAPHITSLRDRVVTALRNQPNLIDGMYKADAIGWTLHFYEELHPAMDDAVARLFVMTCRVDFLQLLRSSRQAIDQRRNEPGFTRFADMFEQVVVPELEDVAELEKLRDKLEDAPALAAITAQNRMMSRAMAGLPPDDAPDSPKNDPPAADWNAAKDAVQTALQPKDPAAKPKERISKGAAAKNAYETWADKEGTWRIRDRHGRAWTSEGLETAIQLRRGVVESAEPLVKQLVEIPEVLERFRNATGGVRAELKTLLDEMAEKNQEITDKTLGDFEFGFEKGGPIVENVREATISGTSVVLQGVHLIAHKEIGEFFRGDAFYARGVDFLFSSELGLRSLTAFGEFVGIVLLTVVCPPAGIAAGIAAAEYHYEEAVEKEDIYKALIDPELVVTRAEVEAGLFAAKLGYALSFLPVGFEIAGAARQAFKVAATEAVEEAATAAARTAAAEAAEAAAVQLITKVEAGLVEKFVVELAKAWLINKVLEAGIRPFIEAIQKEVTATGPVGGLDRALALSLARAQARQKAAVEKRKAQAKAGAH
jgi:hypothetical protein